MRHKLLRKCWVNKAGARCLSQIMPTNAHHTFTLGTQTGHRVTVRWSVLAVFCEEYGPTEEDVVFLCIVM